MYPEFYGQGAPVAHEEVQAVEPEDVPAEDQLESAPVQEGA